MSQAIDTRETTKTQARYNRIAPVYDLMEISAEWRFRPWRKLITARPSSSNGGNAKQTRGEDG